MVGAEAEAVSWLTGAGLGAAAVRVSPAGCAGVDEAVLAGQANARWLAEARRLVELYRERVGAR